MLSWDLRGNRVLDEADVARMHEAALGILARTGIRVAHDAIRSEILRRDGFTLRDGRVLIGPERVRDWLDDQLRRNPARPAIPADPGGPPDFTYSISAYASWILDRDGTTPRRPTRADVVEGAKLAQVLSARGVQAGAPAVPGDVPPALQPIEQYMISAECCACGGSTVLVSDVRTAAIVREMDRVYGRDFGVTVWCPSPLVFGGPNADILWRFRDELAGASVGSMPIMGMNGPCDLAGVMTLAMAECVGGAAMLHALFPAIPVGIFPHPEPADLKTGVMALGTPEWEILDLMHRDVFHFYHVPWNSKLLHTSASLPGAQAQIERATSALLGVQSRFRDFGPIGMIGGDEVWSPAQLILDLDIIAHAARVCRGAEPADAARLSSLADLVHEVVTGGMGFAEHEETVAAIRRTYHEPEVLQRRTREAWLAAGRRDVVREAQARADAFIRRFDYEPPADILRELRRICERVR